jgi:hypothetical protein
MQPPVGKHLNTYYYDALVSVPIVDVLLLLLQYAHATHQCRGGAQQSGSAAQTPTSSHGIPRVPVNKTQKLGGALTTFLFRYFACCLTTAYC